MKLDRDRVFRSLEPPPGGAAKLHARLLRETRPQWPHWRLVTAAVAAAVVLAIIVLAIRPSLDASPDAPSDGLMADAAFDRLLGRESVPVGLSVSRGAERLAVSQVETSSPNVRIYSLEAQRRQD